MVLFDWVSGGHHAVYLRRFVEALEPHFELVLAVPDDMLPALGDLPADISSLGEARPAPPPGRSASWAFRTSAREVQLLASIAAQVRPDHVVHTYADTALPLLATARRLPAPLTIVLFYPRAHYSSLYKTQLAPAERVRATVKDRVVASWRRRPDANAVFTLDSEAARLWARRRGAPAYWLPEPPVPALPPEAGPGRTERTGCILYGTLAERKGIDLLARAVSLAPNALDVTLAGEAKAEFVPRLEEYAAEMRRSGASVHVRSYLHTELEGLQELAASRCAVLPYPRHDGMSRILVEAASVGTPVVAHDRGLLGHLVRRHQLGLAIDCTDPRALRDAVLDLTETPSRAAEHADALAAFSARFAPDRFAAACLEPFAETRRPGAIGREEEDPGHAAKTSSVQTRRLK
jgi:glycosyltransferase involved in cell wall biosynthesis